MCEGRGWTISPAAAAGWELPRPGAPSRGPHLADGQRAAGARLEALVRVHHAGKHVVEVAVARDVAHAAHAAAVGGGQHAREGARPDVVRPAAGEGCNRVQARVGEGGWCDVVRRGGRQSMLVLRGSRQQAGSRQAGSKARSQVVGLVPFGVLADEQDVVVRHLVHAWWGVGGGWVRRERGLLKPLAARLELVKQAPAACAADPGASFPALPGAHRWGWQRCRCCRR